MYTTEDVWDVRLDKWTRLVIKAAVLGALLAGLVFAGMVYFDMLKGVWRLKASKIRLEEGYCRTEHVSPSEYQEICVPARKTIEQNAYVMALDLTGEYFWHKMPMVGYCRTHPDMCTLWGVKLMDVFDNVARWLPMLLPMVLPMLAGLMWKAMTRSCRNKNSSKQPKTTSSLMDIASTLHIKDRQIEGCKTD